MFELKPLSTAAVPAALEKAERYRLLNEPGEAESICRDVLSVDPGNQDAVVTLILALSDQFGRGLPAAVSQACELLPLLDGEYRRHYYEGIVAERRAKARLRQGGPGSGFAAHDWLIQAMACFEAAASQRPADNDEAILRWNACLRLIAKHGLEPMVEERFEPLLE